MRFFVSMSVFLLLASSASATIIPADALVDFQVDAYAPVGNGPYSTHVAAWKNTGLFLNAGDIFALEADGTIWVAPPFTPERGEGPDSRGPGICTACVAEIPDSTAALVGKTGEDLGDEFVVGSSYSGQANDTGYLYLALNDNHYSDNSGFFTVNTAAVPEPSTGLLLAFGLMGLGLAGKRGRLFKPAELGDRSHGARGAS